MTQTKTQSLIEAITNTAVGFGISLAATFVIFPVLGIATTPSKNLLITLFFTAISIIRGYVIRRWFNTEVKPFVRFKECLKRVSKSVSESDTKPKITRQNLKDLGFTFNVVNEDYMRVLEARYFTESADIVVGTIYHGKRCSSQFVCYKIRRTIYDPDLALIEKLVLN
ncbi:DUF7220 family protein [Pseudotamlana carrageenivorans]|uniref:DUF7220 family protein n=1 Tax=Pseudotamlana carrageenivorans TaxID=2069432 RepID=UPI0018F03A1F|nr:hypothetical protein [Tamlana carrageenivorans]